MLKQKIKKWLDRVAEENKNQFGNDRPDCCNINNQHRRRKNNHINNVYMSINKSHVKSNGN